MNQEAGWLLGKEEQFHSESRQIGEDGGLFLFPCKNSGFFILKEEGQSQMFPSSGQTPEGMCNLFLSVAIPK